MIEISPDIREYAHYYRSLYFKDMEKNVLALESALMKNGFSVSWAHNKETLAEQVQILLPKKSHNRVCMDISNHEEITIDKEVINECKCSTINNREFNVDALVIEADFAIVSNGSLVFIDKESQNGFNFVDHLVVIVNLDQVLLNASDLPIFLHIKSQSGFPQDVKIIHSPLTQIIPDPFISSDSKGYSTITGNVSVILYANNTEPLLQDDFLVNSIFCIHCNRCNDVCPVAKTTQISPIDIVKNNCLDEYNRTQQIFSQTTLCGMCQDVCPVNIPLTDLLAYEMKIVNNNFTTWKQDYVYKVFAKRSKLNKTTNFLFYRVWMKLLFGKNKMLQNYFLKNKSTYFAIQEDENNPSVPPSNEII